MTELPDEIVERAADAIRLCCLNGGIHSHEDEARTAIEAILPDLREMIGRECVGIIAKSYETRSSFDIASSILEATRKP